MRFALTLIAMVIIVALLAGCAGTIPADPAKMTSDQLKEWVKDKNANISCGVFNSPYGRGVMTYVVLDRGIIVNGSVSVDNECRVTIQSAVPAKPASAP